MSKPFMSGGGNANAVNVGFIYQTEKIKRIGRGTARLYPFLGTFAVIGAYYVYPALTPAFKAQFIPGSTEEE